LAHECSSITLRIDTRSRYGTSLYGAWVSDVQVPVCSAKGCRVAATTDLRWRNPTLHDAARVKHWLACDEHADFLADFLSRRGFLLGRAPLTTR
jgi:hypothetical protein